MREVRAERSLHHQATRDGLCGSGDFVTVLEGGRSGEVSNGHASAELMQRSSATGFSRSSASSADAAGEFVDLGEQRLLGEMTTKPPNNQGYDQRCSIILLPPINDNSSLTRFPSHRHGDRGIASPGKDFTKICCDLWDGNAPRTESTVRPRRLELRAPGLYVITARNIIFF